MYRVGRLVRAFAAPFRTLPTPSRRPFLALGSVFRPLQSCSTTPGGFLPLCPVLRSCYFIVCVSRVRGGAGDDAEDAANKELGSSADAATDDDVFELVDAPGDKKARKEGSYGVTGSGFQSMQRCCNKRGLTDSVANSHREKMPRKEQVPSTAAGIVEPTLERGVVTVLSYNVWFRESLEVYKRMKALGDLIQEHTPDIICFQEVTPNIYNIFEKSNWWKGYTCSVAHGAFGGRYFCMQMSKLPVRKFSSKPFSNSIMGRELSLAEVDVGMGKVLVVATSHLESPCPGPPKWDQMYSKERVAQAKESISLLGASPNVIFGGDMNWDDKLDGAFPLPEGWIDAWTKLKPREDGWTYDTKSNKMISGNQKLQKRLDRFICNLKDFEVRSIQMDSYAI